MTKTRPLHHRPRAQRWRSAGVRRQATGDRKIFYCVRSKNPCYNCPGR